MSASGAINGVDIHVQEGLSTVTIGGNKVEVSSDGKRVTAYAEGVETKAAPDSAPTSKGRQVSVSDDFNTVVLNGISIELAMDSHLVIAAPNGVVFMKPSMENLPTLAGHEFKVSAFADGGLVQKVCEVGEHLQDGTVCIAVDLKHNEALFAPAGIFGGEAKFVDKDEIPAKLNKDKTRNHGHDDWRNITDEEGRALSEVWNRVAPPALQDRAAPWFWLASPGVNSGRVRRGGEADWRYFSRNDSLPVPVVRSGYAECAGVKGFTSNSI